MRLAGIGADPYAAGLRACAVLRDGTPVCVRAIRADDKERLRRAFERLSERSVYRRFLHPVTELTSDALRQLTELDFRDHVALVVTIPHEAGESIIGVGRFVRMPTAPDQAEIAFTVADEYQHRGVATLLLRYLVGVARLGGVRQFVADILDENRDMLDVLENSRLPLRQSSEDGVCRVVVTLGASPPSESQV